MAAAAETAASPPPTGPTPSPMNASDPQPTSTAANPKATKPAGNPAAQRARQPVAKSEPPAAPPEVDPETAHRNTIVAATFANLELQSTQQTLRQYAQLYESATTENQRLADAMAERDKDAMQVVEYLRQQLQSTEQRLRDAHLKLERSEEEFTKRLNTAMGELQLKIDERDDTISNLRRQLSEAHAKLDDLAHFEVDKQRLLQQIAQQSENERDLTLAHEKELTKVRFASLEEKVKLRAIEKTMTERFDDEVNERAMQLVDTKTQQIRETNIALSRQKAQLEHEVTRLTAQLRTTGDGMAAAKREAELARESHAEYAKQGCKLTRVARDATRRVRDLEARCNDLTRQLHSQKLEAAASRKEAVAGLEGDVRAQREAAEGLRKQLSHMRSLTAAVLDQRSELEQFFYSAIEHTRRMQGKTAGVGDSHSVGRELDSAMAPRAVIGHRGELDARSSVKDPGVTQASTTRPAFMTQALTPRGTGTFLALDGTLEPAPATSSSGARTPRGRGDRRGLGTPRTGSNSRPDTRGTLPHLASGAGSRGTAGAAGGELVETPTAEIDPAVHDHADDDGTLGAFSRLSWADKEKVIAALLLKLNASFYGGRSQGGVARLAAEAPLPEQLEADEEVAEWGPQGTAASVLAGASSRPPTSGQTPAAATLRRAGSTPASAVAFPSSAPGSARGTRPPQPPPTTAPVASAQRTIPRAPSSRPPTGGGTPSSLPPARPALRRGTDSARSSAGSRRATFAPDNLASSGAATGTDDGAAVATPATAIEETSAAAAQDPVVE